MPNWKIDYVKNGQVYILHDLRSAIKPSVLSAQYTEAICNAGQLVMTVTNDHPNLSALEVLTGEVRVWRDTACKFRGYPVSVMTDIDGSQTWTFDGLAAKLAYVPLPRWHATQDTVDNCFRFPLSEYGNNYLASNARVNVSYSGISWGDYYIDYAGGNVLEFFNHMVDQQGGYFLFWYDFMRDTAGNPNGIGLRYYQWPEETNTQRLSIGENIISIEREMGEEGFYNATYAYNPASESYYDLAGQSISKSGYRLDSNGVFYNINSVNKYGFRVKAIEVSDANLSIANLKKVAMAPIVGGLYDRITVSVVDREETEASGGVVDLSNARKNHLWPDSDGLLQDMIFGFGFQIQCDPSSVYEIHFDNPIPVYYTAACLETAEPHDLDTIYGVITSEDLVPGAPPVLTVTTTANATWLCVGYFTDGNDPGTPEEMFRRIRVVKVTSTAEGYGFEVGKNVSVTSAPHGLYRDLYLLTESKRDILNPENITLTLGDRDITLSGL